MLTKSHVTCTGNNSGGHLYVANLVTSRVRIPPPLLDIGGSKAAVVKRRRRTRIMRSLDDSFEPYLLNVYTACSGSSTLHKCLPSLSRRLGPLRLQMLNMCMHVMWCRRISVARHQHESAILFGGVSSRIWVCLCCIEGSMKRDGFDLSRDG